MAELQKRADALAAEDDNSDINLVEDEIVTEVSGNRT